MMCIGTRFTVADQHIPTVLMRSFYIQRCECVQDTWQESAVQVFTFSGFLSGVWVPLWIGFVFLRLISLLSPELSDADKTNINAKTVFFILTVFDEFDASRSVVCVVSNLCDIIVYNYIILAKIYFIWGSTRPVFFFSPEPDKDRQTDKASVVL